MSDDSANRGTMGPRGTKGDWCLRQHRLQAHGTQSRPAAASDEGGNEGDVVRHRAGYGNDGVRTERETAGGAGGCHRPFVGDEEVKSEKREVKSESCD